MMTKSVNIMPQKNNDIGDDKMSGIAKKLY